MTQLNQCHFKNQSFSLSNENHLTQSISPCPWAARKPRLNSTFGCSGAFSPAALTSQSVDNIAQHLPFVHELLPALGRKLLAHNPEECVSMLSSSSA